MDSKVQPLSVTHIQLHACSLSMQRRRHFGGHRDGERAGGRRGVFSAPAPAPAPALPPLPPTPPPQIKFICFYDTTEGPKVRSPKVGLLVTHTHTHTTLQALLAAEERGRLARQGGGRREGLGEGGGECQRESVYGFIRSAYSMLPSDPIRVEIRKRLLGWSP